MSENIYDVIIVGSGPAGMSAAIYTARREMKTLVVGKDVGGQLAKTLVIENAPGIDKTDGVSLAFKMQAQAKNFGVEFEVGEVVKIEKENNKFKINIKENKFVAARSVILSFGLEKRKLGLESEKKLEGKGLSYCVTCDGPLFRGREVAVIGGGNSGAEAVEFLAKICPRVIWIEVMDKINADEVLIGRIEKLTNVEIMTSSEVVEFLGTEKLEGAKVKTVEENSLAGGKEIKFTGAVVEIGYIAKTKWLENLVEFDNFGQVKVDELCHTKTDGLFAAGDMTNIKYKQVAVAEGQGAIAGLEAYEFVQKNFS